MGAISLPVLRSAGKYGRLNTVGTSFEAHPSVSVTVWPCSESSHHFLIRLESTKELARRRSSSVDIVSTATSKVGSLLSQIRATWAKAQA